VSNGFRAGLAQRGARSRSTPQRGAVGLLAGGRIAQKSVLGSGHEYECNGFGSRGGGAAGEMDAQAADGRPAAAQELLRVEVEVRRLCREAKAPAKVAEEVVWRAREVFRPVNGGVFPVAADGKTVLRAKGSEDVLTAAEWTRAQLAAAGALPPGDPAEPVLPMRNPFTRKYWNLTEQMRLQKRDPERAARLKLEAWEKEG